MVKSQPQEPKRLALWRDHSRTHYHEQTLKTLSSQLPQIVFAETLVTREAVSIDNAIVRPLRYEILPEALEAIAVGVV